LSKGITMTSLNFLSTWYSKSRYMFYIIKYKFWLNIQCYALLMWIANKEISKIKFV
jgi:hypothetical protein